MLVSETLKESIAQLFYHIIFVPFRKKKSFLELFFYEIYWLYIPSYFVVGAYLFDINVLLVFTRKNLLLSKKLYYSQG